MYYKAIPIPIPSHSLPHLSSTLITYWFYARWYQTRHKGGHATAFYASLSVGPSSEKHPLLSFDMSFNHKILLFHRKQFYSRSLPAQTPPEHAQQNLLYIRN